MNKKIFIISITILTIILITFGSFKYHKNEKSISEINMCQDDAMILKLITENINPFSKFKFIKKRNEDCKSLLVDNKENALKYKKAEYCSFIDSSTNSITVLINTYVHDMYDRESASKELRTMTPLMTPYDYCPEYIDSMITLINIKKRLGL